MRYLPIRQNKDVIVPAIENNAELICSIVQTAWRSWLGSDYFKRNFTKRFRANFVWEHIIEYAMEQFPIETSIKVNKKNESCLFILKCNENTDVLFRFKKADAQKLSSNVPTQTTFAFHNPEQDLFGITASRVEIIYQLNEIQTQIVDILIVARNGKRVEWAHSLLDSQNNVIQLPLINPVEPDSEEPNVARRIIKPQKKDKKAQNRENK